MVQLTQPKFLWLALVPVLMTVFFLLRRRSTRRSYLLPLSGPIQILRQESNRTKWWLRGVFVLFFLGLLGFAVVAARPITLTSWTKKTSEGIDIAIVFDVSESMEANDFAPTRMVVAKAVIKDFVRRRSEDRIAMTIFGGEAVTKVPLTRDYDFLLSQIDGIQMRELKQGTAIGMGLANGIARLRRSESKTKIIVLITDGDSNVGSINPITAAHLAKQEGIKIYCIGIGKENRVIVPIYAYDQNGKRSQLIAQVPSYINPQLLKDISRLTGGNAYMARDSGMLGRILHEIDKLERTKVKQQPMQKKEEKFFEIALTSVILIAIACLLQETRFRKARLRTLSHVTSN